jgi:Ca2+-binding RTX toxin-like protein
MINNLGLTSGQETFRVIVQTTPNPSVTANVASTNFTIQNNIRTTTVPTSGDDVVLITPTVPGVQSFDGGGGTDTATLDFSAFASSVAANPVGGGEYSASTRTKGGTYRVNLFSVENFDVLGGAGNDSLSGGPGNDVLLGGSGNDSLDGGGGKDVLSGGAGNDLLRVDRSSGAAAIDGGAGTDTLSLNRSNLTKPVTLTLDGHSDFSLPDGTTATRVELVNLRTGSGADHVTFAPTVPGVQFFNGGAGNDTATLDFSAFASSVAANPVGGGEYSASTRTKGGTYRVNLFSVEKLVLLGGTGNDSLNGGAGDDVLLGGGGNDVLSGGAGNDRLSGGGGADTLIAGQSAAMTGGSGTDLFELTTPGTAAFPDNNTIADFSHGTDKVAFSEGGFGLGSKPVAASLFAANSTGAFAAAAQRLAYDTGDGTLFFDADGSGHASSRQLIATLTGHPTLTSGDISFVA